MIDLLYVSFNRVEYTRLTFRALLDHTDWGQVRHLFVCDDGSTDGTAGYLAEACRDCPVPYTINGERFGGPVAAMNWYLDHASPDVEMFGKVDNDMVVCPGWLGEMLHQMELHPRIDILGMEPFLGDPAMPGTVHRDIEPCEHIGGKGLIRHRAFGDDRMTANGYFGFTGWQTSNPDVHKAWIKPDLPVFGLDQMRPDAGPWRGLALVYEQKGWQRLWPSYGGDDHYRWWLDAIEARS